MNREEPCAKNRACCYHREAPGLAEGALTSDAPLAI